MGEPVDPKIIDLIQGIKPNEIQTSVEYFPPRTDDGVQVCLFVLYTENDILHCYRSFHPTLLVVYFYVQNLHARMDRMLVNLKPLFTDITWGAGGSTADLSLKLSLRAHNTGHVANMHLTCTNMTKDGDPVAAVYDALKQAFDGGIRNIVALRGDPPAGQNEWKAAEGGFTCALDLVKFIRKHFGDAFSIAVAGYPEGHPNAITELKGGEEDVAKLSDSEKKRCSNFDGIWYVCKDEDYVKEMNYLKEKVDAGAGEPSLFSFLLFACMYLALVSTFHTTLCI